MRELTSDDLLCVSGGDWSVELNGGVIKVIVQGDEDIQDMAAAAASVVSSAYWGARDAMADFYGSVANFFSSSCTDSGGGGR